MKLIGIGGASGAGKDTVGSILDGYGYQRFAFADRLRWEVLESLSTEDHPIPPCLSPLAVEAFCYATPEEVYAKPTTPRMRALLQQWGTEYRRAQDPEYWLKIMHRALEDVERACITDVRFDDEAEFIRERGGVVWRVDRPGYGPSDHASERLTFRADHVIDNSGDILQLLRQVNRALVIQEYRP